MISVTATELPRFMACNASVSMGGVSPFDTDRTLADEGDAAHWYCQKVFSRVTPGNKAPNGVFITDEIIEDCAEYLKDIRGSGEIEVDTSWASIRGRADHIDFNGTTLTVNDFKYGWKIVEPFENWTLISHAIGWLERTTVLPKFIKFKIYQPRPYHPSGNVREWIINYNELLVYKQRILDTINSPSNQLCTGGHCYKCPSVSQCPAMQIASMNAVDVSYKAFDNEIDNEKLSWMLDNLSRASEVLKQNYNAYEELALHRLRSGQSIPEYTSQRGKGTTRWNDGVTYELLMALTGVDIRDGKLKTPKQSGIAESLLTNLTHRPDTGVKLVRQDVSKKAEKLLGKK